MNLFVPGGSVEAYTSGDDPTFHGWVRLEYDASASIQAGTEIALIDAPVGPHPICLRPSTEILTSAQVAGVQAAKKFAGFAVIRPYRKTAYGLANPCATQIANVFLSLLDISGQLIATASLQIPPQGRISKFLPELLDNSPSDFIGSLRITSDIPIAAGALNILFPEGEFAGVVMRSPPLGVCIQVITPASNPLTDECRNFPTPCDVPDGWKIVSSCN